MSENNKNFLVAVGAGILTALLWEVWGRDFAKSLGFFGGTGAGTGTGGDGAGAGTGGAGSGGSGSGGSGGTGGGVSDYTALAAAINALAAGVALPNIQTVTVALASGDNTLVAGEGGKRVCVLAYGVSGAGSFDARWRTGNATTNLWNMSFSAPAGNSGANLATAWPGYLFATAGGDALILNATAAGASVSVTYWQEAA